MPTESVLSKFYRDYKDILAGSEVVALNALRNISQMGLYGLTCTDKILDFGSGNDVFLQTACHEASKSNQICNWVSYDKYTSSNQSEILCIESGNYDAITLWGVIEDVPDPLATLKALSKLLKPNGFFFITTVDRESTIPYRYKPPEHLTYYTKSSIEAACVCINHRLIQWKPCKMIQDRDVYISILLRTVPHQLRH